MSETANPPVAASNPQPAQKSESLGAIISRGIFQLVAGTILVFGLLLLVLGIISLVSNGTPEKRLENALSQAYFEEAAATIAQNQATARELADLRSRGMAVEGTMLSGAYRMQYDRTVSQFERDQEESSRRRKTAAMRALSDSDLRWVIESKPEYASFARAELSRRR